MVKEDLDEWAGHNSATLETVTANGKKYILGAAKESCVAVFRCSGEEYAPVCIAKDRDGAIRYISRCENINDVDIKEIKEEYANEKSTHVKGNF